MPGAERHAIKEVVGGPGAFVFAGAPPLLRGGLVRARWQTLRPELQHAHKRHALKCRAAAIEHIPGPIVVVAVTAPLAFVDGFAPLGCARAPAGLDGSRDVFGHGRGELHEFATRPFQSKAVLVSDAFSGLLQGILRFGEFCGTACAQNAKITARVIRDRRRTRKT